MTNEIVKQDAQEVQAVSGYEAFREQAARIVEGKKYPASHQDIADAIRALPLPEVAHPTSREISCMAECMDMVRNDLIEMGIVENSVPPMMIPESVAACLQSKTEALLKENEQLRDALNTLMQMDVNGHQLQDRLQFSDVGRGILQKVNAALKGGAA